MRALRAPLLATVGTAALVAGIIGLFVPLLPTTPFVLLASACYARSSPRLHRWLLAHPHLGACIRAFEEGQGLSRRAKGLALSTLWVSIVFAGLGIPPSPEKMALVAIACAVSAWILAMPTLAPETGRSDVAPAQSDSAFISR